MATVSLAIAAFYQIYHTEHKAESLRPKLIIFPDFGGTPLPNEVVFYVYNVGKSVAKNCSGFLTIINKTPLEASKIPLRNVPWTWNEYNKTISQSGKFFEASSEKSNFINILPTQKVTLSLLTVDTLYGEPLADNTEVPPMKFAIRVDVYAENMTTAASYPIELKCTKKAFDIRAEQIRRDQELKDKLEGRLEKEKFDELMNLRESIFYKR